MNDTKQSWKSLEDYMKVDIFGYDCSLENGIKSLFPFNLFISLGATGQNTKGEWVLKRNTFPYSLKDGIEHHCTHIPPTVIN